MKSSYFLVLSIFFCLVVADQVPLGVDFYSTNTEWYYLDNLYAYAGGTFPEGYGFGWADAAYLPTNLGDAFDIGMVCMINDQYFSVSSGFIEQVQDGHYVAGPEIIGDFSVTYDIRVHPNRDVNSRGYITLEYTGDTPQTANVYCGANSGADSNFFMVTTSNGDDILENSDYWAYTGDNYEYDPRLFFVFGDGSLPLTDSTTAVFNSFGNQGVGFQHSLFFPSSGTQSLMFFVELYDTSVDVPDFSKFLNLNTLKEGDNLVEDLDDSDFDTIMNWYSCDDGFTLSPLNTCVIPPENDECIDSIEISNYERIFGITSNSLTLSSDIPSCSLSFEKSPVLFYKYTSLYDYEEIIIDTCLSNSDFDTYLSVYIGDCDNLQCIGFDNDSCDGNDGDDDDYNLNKSKVILSGSLNGVAAGTNIIIAVHGTDNEDGSFTLRIQEKEELPNTCNSNGPYIQCPSSIQIPSTTMCDNNQQCAITPSFDMGSCSDLCGCSIQQINGTEPGDEISGRNSITLQATNNNDISNECSFNIIVQNSCNTNGPIVDGCEDLIYLETENTCATNDGNECVILDTNGMGAICHDSCGCSIYQSSGPVSGDKLEPGTYEIVFSGLNDLGMESSSSSSCISTIIVNSRS
mmetsp:Transcript_8762/g.14775  ORF Transcript_8762/g.14775 Transcript_8762/m.14775 type:complete len:631 (-) Transcript_8762:114-2006(-)